MKEILKTVIYSITDIIWLIYHILSLIFEKGTFKNNINKTKKDKIIILANGPSLKKELPRLSEMKSSNIDFIALNYFANNEFFLKIKPKDYCFADPMFFRKTHRKSEALELLKTLNTEVTWNMNIYIPSDMYTDFLKFNSFTNKKLHLIRVNTKEYNGKSRRIRYFLFKKALSTPIICTVANLAIFVALNKGVKEIELYGVDHTFFDNLGVNEKNQVCRKETHFYDNDSGFKPILRNDNDKNFIMSDYVFMVGNMFKSHDILSEYATHLGSKIINKTKESLIDSYSRD